MGSGSAVQFRDQGSGCTIFVGSGTKMGHAFGIKDQKFAYENGISEENTYLVTTLRKRFQAHPRLHQHSDKLVSDLAHYHF